MGDGRCMDDCRGPQVTLETRNFQLSQINHDVFHWSGIGVPSNWRRTGRRSGTDTERTILMATVDEAGQVCEEAASSRRLPEP